MNHYFYDFPLYLSPSLDIPAKHLVGLNDKNLLIVLSEEDFSIENKEFLTKILAAVQLDLDKDAHILSVPASHPYAANKLMNSGHYDRCLIFGINAINVGFSFETHLYRKMVIAEKQYLVGHPLEKLKASTNYKKALWTELQRLFQD